MQHRSQRPFRFLTLGNSRPRELFASQTFRFRSSSASRRGHALLSRLFPTPLFIYFLLLSSAFLVPSPPLFPDFCFLSRPCAPSSFPFSPGIEKQSRSVPGNVSRAQGNETGEASRDHRRSPKRGGKTRTRVLRRNCLPSRLKNARDRC